MSVQKTVEDAIASNKIVVFSKSYCPFCRTAKGILNSEFPHLKDKIHVQELDQVSNGAEIQDYLLVKYRQRTVPNIFINGKHVGGCDAIESLKSQNMLASLVDA